MRLKYEGVLPEQTNYQVKIVHQCTIKFTNLQKSLFIVKAKGS